MPVDDFRRFGRSIAVKSVVGSAAGAMLTAALDASGVHGAIWYLVVIGAFAGIAVGLLLAVTSPVTLNASPLHGAPKPVSKSTPTPLSDMSRRVENGTAKRVAFSTGLQPLLRDLVDDRLKRTIGMDYAAAAAADSSHLQQLVGQELWSWLQPSAEETKGPTMSQLEVIITSIESLS